MFLGGYEFLYFYFCFQISYCLVGRSLVYVQVQDGYYLSFFLFILDVFFVFFRLGSCSVGGSVFLGFGISFQFLGYFFFKFCVVICRVFFQITFYFQGRRRVIIFIEYFRSFRQCFSCFSKQIIIFFYRQESEFFGVLC